MYSLVARETPKNGMTIGYTMRRGLTLLQAEILRDVYVEEGILKGDQTKAKFADIPLFAVPLSALSDIKEYIIEADTLRVHIDNCIGNEKFIHGDRAIHVKCLREMLADWKEYWYDIII